MDGRRNWDWHNVVDVSPFLRYESTGDSDQVNTDLNMDHAEVKSYEADDALSCCSDSYDNTTFNKKNWGDDHGEERAQCSKKKSKKKEECYATFLKKRSKKKEQDLWYNPNCRNCNDDGDDDDGGSINQVWSSCGNIGYVASSQQQKKKSSKLNAFDGSSMEPKAMNDKLFWDTCLDN